MTVYFTGPIKLAVGVALADIGDAVPAGKLRNVDLRMCNTGAADVYVDVFLVNTNDATQNHYRAKNFKLPYQDLASAPDMERLFTLTAGWKVQLRASAATSVDASMTHTQTDAPV